MSRVKKLVQWFDNTGTMHELDDVERINITRGSGAKNNTADIFLKNPISQRGEDGRLYTKYVNSETGLIKFSEGDTIKIFVANMTDNRAIDTSDDSADLIMSAEIQEINTKTDSKTTQVKLSCVDKVYVILNVLWSSNYLEDGDFNTAPLMVQNVIRWASSNGIQGKKGYDSNGDFVLNGPYQIDARLESEGGFIEDTRQDGTAFPTTSLAKVFKPIYEWLDELSSLEQTNDFDGTESEDNPVQDRNMMYYIDQNNKFHWFYPKDQVVASLTTAIASSGSITTIEVDSTDNFDSKGTVQIGAEMFEYTGTTSTSFTGVTRSTDNTSAEAHAVGDDVSSYQVIEEGDITKGSRVLKSDVTLKTYDIINAVIFNAGDDMNGSGILGFFYDKTTESPKLKMVYKAWTTIARDMKRTEKVKGTQLGATTITHVDGDEYDYPSDYTFYGVGQSLPWWNPGADIDSDSDFNNSLRDAATYAGKYKAKQLTSSRGNQRYKGTVTLQFRRFNPGNLVKYTSGLSGLRGKFLRIKKAQYNLSKNSDRVTLTLEEDDKKVGT